MNNKFRLLLIIILIISALFIWYYYLCDTSFEILDENMEVSILSSQQIKYQLKHTLKKIKWSSSNENIILVDDKGIVKAIGYGSAIITGTIEEVSRDIIVNAYSGKKDIDLEKVEISSDVSIFLDEEKEIPFSFTPHDAYVYLIDYQFDEEGIASISNNKIKGLSEGITNLSIKVNSLFENKIKVRVLDKNSTKKDVTNVTFNRDKIILDLGEGITVDYNIEPSDGYVYDAKWKVQDEDIISFNNGIIKALNYGSTKISLTINGDIEKEIEVIVSKPTSGINLYSATKIIMKVGVNGHIIADVSPSDAIQKLTYTSSDSNVLEVTNSGELIAKSVGNGTITLETEDKKNSKSIEFIVHPKVGVVNGYGGIWEYNSEISYTPVRANINFFNNLVSAGMGTINDNKYTFNNYVYEINNSVLHYNNNSIYMRIYYPPNVDLSSLNTFTFLGGTGERKFAGYFANIDKNPSILQSRGIQILIAARETGGYDPDMVIECTNFVKQIIKQKNNAINTVGGYSLGGPDAGRVAEKGDYQRLLIFDSYFVNVTSNINLKEKEIVFYSPNGDSMAERTKSALGKIKSDGTYKKVYIVSNSQEMINRYKEDFLIINPGSIMGSGHGNNIITNSHFFMYSCG